MVAKRKNNNTLNFPFSQLSRSALHVVILRRKRDSRIMKTQSGTTTQSKCCKMFGCRSIKLHSSALLCSHDTAKKSLCSCTARMFIHTRLEEYCLRFLELLVCVYINYCSEQHRIVWEDHRTKLVTLNSIA